MTGMCGWRFMKVPSSMSAAGENFNSISWILDPVPGIFYSGSWISDPVIWKLGKSRATSVSRTSPYPFIRELPPGLIHTPRHIPGRSTNAPFKSFRCLTPLAGWGRRWSKGFWKIPIPRRVNLMDNPHPWGYPECHLCNLPKSLLLKMPFICWKWF